MTMRRMLVLGWITLIALAATVTVLLAAPDPGTGQSDDFLLAWQATAHVTITNDGLEPAMLTVPLGIEVIWYNASGLTHVLQSGQAPSDLFHIYMPFVLRSWSGVAAARSARFLSLTSNGTFSGTILPGGTFTHAFQTVGDFPYFLTTAPSITGRIVVLASPLQPDFELSFSPAHQVVTRGEAVSYTAAVTWLHGLTEEIRLSLSGYPAGADGEWGSFDFVGDSARRPWTITPSLSAPTGLFRLLVTGTAGSLVHTATAELEIVAEPPLPTPDFRLAVWPPTQTVTRGHNITYTVEVSAIDDFNASVSLAVGGYPSGTLAWWEAPELLPGSQTSLVLTPSASSPSGTFSLLITGTAAGLTRTAQASLVVVEEVVPPTPDFELVVTPSYRSVVQGQAAIYTVQITGHNGFTEPVSLFFSSSVKGVEPLWASEVLTPPAQTELVLLTAFHTPEGDYTLVVDGIGGGLVHSSSFTMAVTPHPDFDLGVTPQLRSVRQGQAVTCTVSLSAQHGFDAPVTLDVGELPAGVMYAWTSPVVTPDGSTALNLTTALTTPVGSHGLVITATGGGWQHTVPFTLDVSLEPLDLVLESFQVYPPASLVGQAVHMTVTVHNRGGEATGSPFQVDGYVNPPSPPSVSDGGAVSWTVDELGAGQRKSLTTTYTFTSAGKYELWAQVDTLDVISEIGETNNVAGPVTLPVDSTALCGTLDQDRTLYAGVVYTVCRDSPGLIVAAGATLTVEGGAELQFVFDGILSVYGTLVAMGTAARPITFTGFNPTPGEWRGLYVVGGQVNLTYTSLRYGGRPHGGTANRSANLYLYDNASASLDHVTVANSSGHGIHVNPSTGASAYLTMSHSLVRDNGSNSVVHNGLFVGEANGATAHLTISHTSFISNTRYAAYLNLERGTFSGHGLDGAENWRNGIALRGSFGQDTLLTVNPGFPYIIPSGYSFAVNSGVTLTLPASSVIKLESGAGLIVAGVLQTRGTAGQPVYMTSIKDDSLEGDTNNDGDSLPAPGDWGKLNAAAGGRIELDDTVLRYGGGNSSESIYLSSDATAVLDHTAVLSSSGRGIHLNPTSGGVVSLTIKASRLEGNASHGILLSGSGSPRLGVDDCVLRGNGGRGVQVDLSSHVSITDSSLISNALGLHNGFLAASTISISRTNIYGNSEAGVRNDNNSVTLAATHNWWGDAAGPCPPAAQPACTGFLGDKVRGPVNYSPWLTVPVPVRRQPLVHLTRH